MRDVLEEQLAQRLRAVAEHVPAELDPPEDLPLRVARARRSRRLATGLTVLTVAALIVAAVAIVASVQHTAPAKREVAVAKAPHDHVSLVGRIKPNVVMLDARDHFVVALDRAGNAVDTLVVSKGKIVDAQLTRDQTTVWYLVTNGDACGQIVRADIGTGATRGVQSAEFFAISPDGNRLAYFPCGSSQLQVRELDAGAAPSTPAPKGSAAAWTPDGRELVRPECAHARCVVRYGAQSVTLPPPLRLAVGSDGLYFQEGSQIRVLTGRAGDPAVVLALDPSWSVDQLVPTRGGLFLYARTPTGAALYHVDAGKPVRLSTFGFGTLRPVFPLP